MRKFTKSLIFMVSVGLLVIIGHPVSAEQSQKAEQQKCVEYLKKCFSPEEYEYLFGGSNLTTNDCFIACKSTFDKDYDCGFDACLEMCKVASGHSKSACPIPTEQTE